MKIIKKIFRFLLLIILIIIIAFIILFFGYFNNLKGVHPTTISYYNELQSTLVEDGYSNALVVMSAKRNKWHNDLLSKYGGAAKNSRHLKGEAIDVLVLDVNDDGKMNSEDVDIVYNILDNKIIKNKGGIGTYKNDYGFFNKQMVHFDCRGQKARWHR